MSEFNALFWIELRKALRSRMPLWVALGSLSLPFGIGFLIFVARNPEIAANLSLVSAKANLVAYSAADWGTYLRLFGEFIAAGEFFVFVLAASWIFGREFADGTLKDLLAVPVRRGSILLAKFAVLVVWSAALAALMLAAGLLMGWLIGLPGGSAGVILSGLGRAAVIAGLVIVATLPFGWFASIGRGYLLPVGLAVLVEVVANLLAMVGWGDYFPWAVPGLYAQADAPLAPVSFWILFLTGLAGLLATYLWWKFADQSR